MSVSKREILLDGLKRIVDSIDTSKTIGKRDKAMILVSFATVSRRSELVSINIEDIDFTIFGMDIYIKQEKSHEVIMKSVVAVGNEYCPVKASQEWVEHANITEGAVFRSVDRHGNIKDRTNDKTVARVIKKYVTDLGLNPDGYAGHSLRSGLATSASQEGMNHPSIMNQTGHKTHAMVDRYVKRGSRYKNNASSILKNL